MFVAVGVGVTDIVGVGVGVGVGVTDTVGVATAVGVPLAISDFRFAT